MINRIEGLPMGEYLAMTAISASVIKAMPDCPRAAWHQSYLNSSRVPDDTAATDAGTISHQILLEGSFDCCTVIDPSDHPAEKTGAIPLGWTNKSIRAARDAARAEGKIPILLDDLAEIHNVVQSAQAYIESLKDIEPAIWRAFQPDGGTSETVFLWDDGPTPCRIRTDRISTDNRLIVDLKTTGTSANPGAWARTQLFASGYDVSAAFYQRGIEAVCDVVPTYVFLVVSTAPPYLCSMVSLDPAARDMAAQKVALGLRDWQRCVKENAWPAYPRRICYAEPPGWMVAQAEAQQLDDPFLERATA